jgi:hypothetical protein
MIGLMFRGVFLISIISWYSYGVFKMINDYFRGEYKTYLTDEFRKNKHLMPNGEETTPKDQQSEIKSFKLPDYPQVEERRQEEEVKFNEIKMVFENADESIVNYWINRKKSAGNDDANAAYCHVTEDEHKCKDN